jgi:hypothetical protein
MHRRSTAPQPEACCAVLAALWSGPRGLLRRRHLQLLRRLRLRRPWPGRHRWARRLWPIRPRPCRRPRLAARPATSRRAPVTSLLPRLASELLGRARRAQRSARAMASPPQAVLLVTSLLVRVPRPHRTPVHRRPPPHRGRRRLARRPAVADLGGPGAQAAKRPPHAIRRTRSRLGTTRHVTSRPARVQPIRARAAGTTAHPMRHQGQSRLRPSSLRWSFSSPRISRPSGRPQLPGRSGSRRLRPPATLRSTSRRPTAARTARQAALAGVVVGAAAEAAARALATEPALTVRRP